MKQLFAICALAGVFAVYSTATAQIDYYGQPKSLIELVNKSEVIVEAEPQTIFPAEAFRGTQMMYSDVLFRVVDVIKGPKNLWEFVAATRGGFDVFRTTGAIDPRTRDGRRYILFLVSDTAVCSAGLPQRPVDRYEMPGGAAFFILAGKTVTVSGGYLQMPWTQEFQKNADAATVVTELKLLAAAR